MDIKKLRKDIQKAKRRIATFEKHGIYSEAEEKLESRLNIINNNRNLFYVSKNMSNAELGRIKRAIDLYMKHGTYKDYVKQGKKIAQSLGIEASEENAIDLQERLHDSENAFTSAYAYRAIGSQNISPIIRGASEKHNISGAEAKLKLGNIIQTARDNGVNLDLNEVLNGMGLSLDDIF